MEVVHASPSNGAPFHNNDVREWSRLDSLTGVLERARLETDHWTASTANTSHKYNKVVDSRARSGADGNLQQQARRKLEVFQSQVPGGRIQVIKTQSISSSRWSHKSSTNPNDFEDLKLSLNPLDLTSEKSKASVGRSVGRRPPSRSRIRDDILSRNLHTAAATNFHRVSRLCNQIHENAVRRTINRQPIGERQSGDGVEIVEIENEHNRPSLTRTKSTSSDDLHDTKKSLEDLEDLEQLQNWRRTSKLRRSLQFPRQKTSNQKPPDLPGNKGNVRKIKEDLETGRRLSTALRGNNVDLEALDQILKSISNSSVSSTHSDQNREEELEDHAQITPSKSEKRNSFVTVESIQAVRDRLRRTSLPTIPKNEDTDDGIVKDQPATTKTSNAMSESRVKSYIYGMENIYKKNPNNTGSLESRSNKTHTSLTRGEDWFTRRKSYGFEQMHNQQETISKSSKAKIESSTDSGICRSSEIVLIPPSTKTNVFTSTSESVESLSESEEESKISNVKKYTSIFENKIKTEDYWSKRQKEGVTITIPISTSTLDTSKSTDDEKGQSKNKRISLALLDKFEDLNDDEFTNKKHNKKVEFCKTEVHFAADSGRVNIVETDEKPPPTQNFRRRRRNSGLTESYAKNLPVLHFGDTSYEKSLFSDSDNTTEAIYENINNPREVIVSGNVTVNAYQSEYEEQKENIENEAPKGILKNKPVKPKPYILGENEEFGNSDSDSDKTWGVRLKPTSLTSVPATAGSTSHAVKDEAPLWRSTVTVRNTFYDQASEEQPEFQKLLKQLRPTSKKTDEITSVKRNSDDFNNNVRVMSPVIDTRRSSWSVADRIKQVEDLNWGSGKGYSTKVNFGDGEATVVENRHPTWPRKEEYSKDLKKNLLNKSLVVRIGRSDTNSKHTVCSKTTTNSDNNGTTTTTKITIDLTPSPTNDGNFKFPRASLHSFKSPSLIMNTIRNDNQVGKKIQPQLDVLRKLYDDVHSDSEADKEVHRILMNSRDHFHEDNSSVLSGSWSKIRAFKHISQYQKTSVNSKGSHAFLEKDNENETTKTKLKLLDEQIQDDLRYLNEEVANLNKEKVVLRKNNLNSAFACEKLSSPQLVVNSAYSSDQEVTKIFETKREEKSAQVVLKNQSPIREKVLRQPKKSELAYFGVGVNPTPKVTHKKVTKLSEKPDLLQFSSYKDDKNKFASPIYENLEMRKSNFDSSILDELTKAADQILQAVNGYTDEEYQNKVSSEEEKPRIVLDTISETKSWQQKKKLVGTNSKINNTKSSSNKSKLKPTSSNSSIDSISRECRRSMGDNKRPFMTKSAEQKQRKKVVTSDSTKVSTTKARRLQRASSREALLQSHGSSSEDLAMNHVEVVRKPRLVRKTKTAQLTVSNGLELKKPVGKREEAKSKQEERVPVVGLPEIRHKTAVSTIRSTAEKAASRERAKLRSEELRKQSGKKDVRGSSGASLTKSERLKSAGSREVRHTTVTSQKKPNRVETITKH